MPVLPEEENGGCSEELPASRPVEENVGRLLLNYRARLFRNFPKPFNQHAIYGPRIAGIHVQVAMTAALVVFADRAIMQTRSRLRPPKPWPRRE